jgi:hypothetical protein
MINILKPKIIALALALSGISSGLLPDLAHSQDFSDFFSNNGSFEFGSSPPPLSFPSSNSSVNTITGWTVYAGGITPRWLENSAAQDGNRYIELRSNGGSSSGDSGVSIEGGMISHTPFNIGDLYELSFWAAGGASPNNLLQLDLSGGVREYFDIPDYTSAEFAALPGLEWNRYAYTFRAPFNSISLIVSSPDSTNPAYRSTVYLDNFSIVAVPEPSGVLLVLTAGLVLGTRRRRMDLSHV